MYRQGIERECLSSSEVLWSGELLLLVERQCVIDGMDLHGEKDLALLILAGLWNVSA